LTGSSPPSVEWVALIGKTVSAYRRLDILVNNAGISGSSVDRRSIGPISDEALNVAYLARNGKFESISLLR
jgi:NAD(P)-dependent dehydrogenase (short-subunit alcohol dehydrogenase family)